MRWKLGGCGREVARQRADEGVLVLAREQAVEAPLEADRRSRLLAHPGTSAERAADVPGPDLREVPERQETLQRLVEPARALLLVDGEIGPGDVADEERVPGDDEPRLVSPAFVRDEVGGVLGPMAGRGKRRDGDVSDLHSVAVRQRLVRELDFRRRRDVDGRARRRRQPALAGDVVGVVVRLEHVGDGEAVLLREPKVVRRRPTSGRSRPPRRRRRRRRRHSPDPRAAPAGRTCRGRCYLAGAGCPPRPRPGV